MMDGWCRLLHLLIQTVVSLCNPFGTRGVFRATRFKWQARLKVTDEVASLQDVSQDLLLGLLIPFDQEAVLDWLKPSFDSGKKMYCLSFQASGQYLSLSPCYCSGIAVFSKSIHFNDFHFHGMPWNLIATVTSPSGSLKMALVVPQRVLC